MRNDIQLKQQAQMLKAAWEEGWKNADQVSVDGLDFFYPMEQQWLESTAKQMYDQLLMEAQGGLNAKT